MKNNYKISISGIMCILTVSVFAIFVVLNSIGSLFKNYDNLSVKGSVLSSLRRISKILGVGTPVLNISSPADGAILAAGTIFAQVSGVTDVPAICKMGQNSGDTFYSMNQALSITATTTHGTTLSPLKNDNAYSIYAQCRDDIGNLSNLVSIKFYVSAAPLASVDITPPVVSNLTLVEISPTSTKLAWSTDEVSDTQIEYGANLPVYSLKTQVVDTGSAMTGSHVATISGLAPGILYYFRAVAKDASGNVGRSADFSTTMLLPNSSSWQTPNSQPPQTTIGDLRVFHIRTESITSSQAYVKWETENLTYGQVEFGETTGYGTTTLVQEKPVFTNYIALQNLKANTWYHYRVLSTDLAGKKGMSGDGAVYTGDLAPALSPSPTPAVSPPTPLPSPVPAQPPLVATVVLPASVNEGDIVSFRRSSKVYLIRADGLHVFTSSKALLKYRRLYKKRIKYFKTTVSPYTKAQGSASEVLGW